VYFVGDEGDDWIDSSRISIRLREVKIEIISVSYSVLGETSFAASLFSSIPKCGDLLNKIEHRLAKRAKTIEEILEL
jgi:hypothetical protein